MAEKRVNVRLAAVGGRQVREQLEGVGQAGAKGMKRFRSEVDRANERLARFARRARRFARIAAAAVAGAVAAMVRSGLRMIDNQAKLAQSLDTTVASVQVLERAGQLAGVSMGEVEQATRQLTRRLSQAAGGSGPAADALDRLNLSAARLVELPLDERVATIQNAIARFIPEAERAAVASQIFGDRAGLIFSRIDASTLAQANRELREFGVLVSDQDAAQIERTNDAISRLGLIWRGLSNQLAVAVAPALERVAGRLGDLASQSGPLGRVMRFLGENIERVGAALGVFAGLIAGRIVARIAAFALGIRGAATAFALLRGAMIRVPFVGIAVLATELVVKFSDLVKGAGGFGEALRLLGDVALGVFQGIIASGSAVAPALEAVWQRVKASFLNALADMADRWRAFISNVASVSELFGMVLPGAGLFGRGAQKLLSDIDELRASADSATERSRELAAVAKSELSEGFAAAREAFARVNEAIERGKQGAEELPVDPGLQEALRKAALAGKDVNVELEKIAKDGGGGGAGRAGAALKDAGDTAKDAWDQMLERMREARERAKETASDLANDITGPIKSALKEGELSWRSFAGAVASIAQNLANRLIDVAFKPIEDGLISALTGGGSGGGFLGLFGGGGGGGLAGLLPFARGGAFSRGGEMRAFARGGVVDRPTVFPFANGTGLMGEAGPEAIMPLRRGRGGRLGVEATGGGQERGTRIVNILDPSIVGDFLATPDGERTIVNTIRRNREAINA